MSGAAARTGNTNKVMKKKRRKKRGREIIGNKL